MARGGRRAIVVLLVAVLGFVGLTGCGGGDGDGDPIEETAATAGGQDTIADDNPGDPAADGGSTPALPSIGQVVWASAVDPVTNAPTERVEQFSVDAGRLYAVVEVAGLPIGAVVSGVWTYNGVALAALDAEVAITGPTAEAAWIEFHLEWADDAWPEGTYEIAIGVDGEILRTSSVAVIGAG